MCLFCKYQNSHVQEFYLPVDEGGDVLRMKEIYGTGCHSFNTPRKQQLIPPLSMSPLDLVQCKTMHPLVKTDLLIEKQLNVEKYKRGFHSQYSLYLNQQMPFIKFTKGQKNK